MPHRLSAKAPNHTSDRNLDFDAFVFILSPLSARTEITRFTCVLPMLRQMWPARAADAPRQDWLFISPPQVPGATLVVLKALRFIRSARPVVANPECLKNWHPPPEVRTWLGTASVQMLDSSRKRFLLPSHMLWHEACGLPQRQNGAPFGDAHNRAQKRTSQENRELELQESERG